MTQEYATELAGLFFSFIGALSAASTEERTQKFIGYWLLHIAACLIAGLLLQKDYQFIVLIWIFMFFCILTDALTSKFYAQIVLLTVGLLVLISTIGLANISSTSYGWVILFVLFLTCLVVPIIMGMVLFSKMIAEQVTPLKIALIISVDYFVGTELGGLVSDYLSSRLLLSGI